MANGDTSSRRLGEMRLRVVVVIANEAQAFTGTIAVATIAHPRTANHPLLVVVVIFIILLVIVVCCC